MIITQYYNFEAPELGDAPDVSYLSVNWQDLDDILHDKADLGVDGKVLATQLPAMNYVTPTGDGSTVTVNFTEAATDIDIATGDTLAVIAGKLLKNIHSLQTATGNNATAISNIINGTTKVGSASNADTVGGFTVGKSVPANALFTDTVYTHPSTHPYSMLTGAPSSLPANGGNADTVDGLHASAFVNAVNVGATNVDPNTTAESLILTNHANSPGGSIYWHISTTFYASKSGTANRAQVAVSYNGATPRMCYRHYYSPTWTPWIDVKDANTVGGLAVHTGVNNVANQIVRTDSNGYINAGWINTVSGAASGTIARVYCSQDAYLRYLTPANFISSLGLLTTSSTINAAQVDGKSVWVGAEASRGSDANTLYFCY